MLAALELVERELFGYVPRHGWTGEVETQGAFTWLREKGVTPADVLQRVAEVAAVEHWGRARFGEEREVHYAYARSVLRLGKMGTWRPAARLLRFMGPLIVDELAPWAVGFLRRLDKDQGKKADRKSASMDFSES